MDLTLHVVGYGRLAAAILPRLRAAMPALGITVHSRTPARVQLEGVTATDAALEPGNDPVLILASADEGRVLAAMPRPPGADIPRGAVLEANVAHLRARLAPRSLAARPLLVITNPVEAICDFLHRWTGNDRVLGLGLATDGARLDELVTVITGLPPPRLALTGFHDFRVIPLLSERPSLRADLLEIPQVADRLAGWEPPYARNPTRLCPAFLDLAPSRVMEVTDPRRRALEILDAALRALTLTEFDEGRPPVERPAESLAGSLIQYFSGHEILASAFSPLGGGVFTGGRHDPVSGAHVVPCGDEVEERLLADAREERRAWAEVAR